MFFTTKQKQPSARALARIRATMSEIGVDHRAADRLAIHMKSPMQAKAIAESFQGSLALMEALKSDLDEGFEKVLAEFEKALEESDLKEDPEGQAAGNKACKAVSDMLSAALAATNPMRANAGSSVPTPHDMYGRSWDAGPGLRAKQVDALYARMNPAHKPTMGREFMNASMAEHARICLKASGASRSWFGGDGQMIMDAMHTTSDFPNILGDTANRVLIDEFELQRSPMITVSAQREARDFRELSTVRLGGTLELEETNEDGEFKYGTLNEAGASFAVKTYGKIFGLTRQAIVNDDLGAFGAMARIQGQSAALAEAKVFASLLLANGGDGPTMPDGLPLFDEGHGNVAATGSPLSVASLGQARMKMRRQKGLNGEPIAVSPFALIIPPELEVAAEQVLHELDASEVSEVNPFAGKLRLLVDPHLTSPSRWYVAAAPYRPVSLQHAYLAGASAPELFVEEGFGVDGVRFKVRHDFGAGFADWRGWVMNPGA